MVVGLTLGIVYLFCDIIYWTKWAASLVALWLRKTIHPRRFDLYDFELDNEPYKTGVLVPKEEKRLESPLSEELLQSAADEVFIYGVNSKSEIVVVRISRSCNDVSEAYVYLKLADGRLYELEKSDGFQRNFGGKCTSFSCGGLQMHYLSAMRRWRIVYCGMLRERKHGDELGNKTVFVKFTFIWTASSDVYDASSDLDIRSTAKAMARAKWNSPFPPVQKISEFMDVYCQSGVLNGMVSVEEEPEKEMYLYGERMRYIGKYKYLDGCKLKHVLGAVPESGLMLHIAKATIPNIANNLYFGFIVHPNGILYGIEDGVIVSNLSGTDVQGKNLTAMIKAGKHQYELRGDFVRNGMKFTSEKLGRESKIEFTEIEFQVDDCTGSGLMISADIRGLREMKIQKIPRLPPSTKSRTVFFADEEAHFTDLSGGKGSSLAKLTKLSDEMKSQFVVPRGMVVTTVAYEEFLTCEIMEKIENLKNVVYGNVKGNLHEACKMVSSAIERTHLPEKTTKEIEEKLNKLFDGNIDRYRIAVRSSATGEDTDQMSAAGQMETFLGVQGLKEILTAVKKCWASQFGFIAVEYKRQNGQILNSPMAVVLQEMVECEAAGVLFTCDPVTNNPSVTVITGNYGLGESVVSGSEEPDTVVLEKLPDDEVKIKSVIVGMKQHKIVMKDQSLKSAEEEEDGTITEDVSEDEKNKCCISEEMAIELGRLASKIENFFKSPRDIEWGIKNGTIYMLQSRPITTGAAMSDYEIKHELDAPLRCETEFFTKSNVGEVLPGATSPLGFDVSSKYFSVASQKKSMRQKQRNNFMQMKYFPVGIPPFYFHVFIGVADMLTREEDLDEVRSQGMMMALFGRLLDDPDLYALIKRRKYDLQIKNVRFYFTYLKNLFFSGHGIKEITQKVFNYQCPALKGRTSKEVFNLLFNDYGHHAESFIKHLTCTEMSSFWNMNLISVLGGAHGTIDSVVYGDFAKLLSTMSNVESADVPSSMQDLARTIVKDIKSEDFKAMPVEEALEWLQKSTGLPGLQFRQFLKRHGHRCLKEFDMHSVTWGADPKPLIKLLQNMAGTLKDIKGKSGDSNAFPPLSVSLNFKARLLVKLILPNCRRGVREREACKSNMIKTYDNARKGFQHLSKTMVAEGYLPDTDLLYFMTVDEIENLLESRNPKIIARANHRRRLFPTLDGLFFPEISKGRPVPINENRDDEEFQYVSDLTMKGIPVSQGSVRGYARVALSLEEAAHLKPGEILITYSTDIGWSPYFPIVAGVVTELGGLISHGAVVSREYGLPCVVGLHGATKQFLTGDYVLLDGNKGILQRLSPPQK